MNTIKLTNVNVIYNNLLLDWSKLSIKEFLKEFDKTHREIKLDNGITL